MYANRNFEEGDAAMLVGKYLQSMVVEGSEITEKIKILFEQKKNFRTDVKLVDSQIWLNLSVGPMNDYMATVVATDILVNYLYCL